MLSQRRTQEGKELATRSVAIRRRHLVRIHTALDTLGQAHAILGELDAAHSCFLEATALAIQAEDIGTVFYALHGLAFTLGMRGRSDDALRVYYCAPHLWPEYSGRYDEPLAPHLTHLMGRLRNEAGSQLSQRLRMEGESLDVGAALRLARAEI
jgi:hypothetical protein